MGEAGTKPVSPAGRLRNEIPDKALREFMYGRLLSGI